MRLRMSNPNKYNVILQVIRTSYNMSGTNPTNGVSEQCKRHLKGLESQVTQLRATIADEIPPQLINQITELAGDLFQETHDTCGLGALTDVIHPEYAGQITEFIGGYASNADTVAAQDLSKSITTMAVDHSVLTQSLQNKNAVRAETIAMNMQKATEEMDTAIRSLRNSANTYQSAVQLEKTGEHVGRVQVDVSNHNKQILAKLASDMMTAKRVATINQQNTLHEDILTGYLQLCSIFVAIGIVSMFIFYIPVVRSFFRHPFVVMQCVLVLLAIILTIIIMYRVVTNNNHYWMLYQERVFADPAAYEHTLHPPKCPELAPQVPVARIAYSADVVQNADESCDAY